MKKLLCLVGLVALFATANAQNSIILSGGFEYGKFTDDFGSKIYPSFGGVDFSLATKTGVDWISLGLFVKQSSAKGKPALYGLTDPNASCNIAMLSWGPQVDFDLLDDLSFFARLGAVKVTEDISSSIGSVSGSVKGTSFSFGAKYFLSLSKSLRMYIKYDYSTISLKDSEAKMDNWTLGVGAEIKF